MGVDRTLAAILFSDIVGYTRLMSEDQDKGLDILRRNRKIQQPLIRIFGGELLKEMGDGILASFSSASNAVLCAAAIQQSCGSESGFQLRIGIHFGEVVFERGDVFGDGVNIAARIERLCQPKGVLVSESVYEKICHEKGMSVSSLGPKELKNVVQPILVYEVKVDPDVIKLEQLGEKIAVRNRQSDLRRIITTIGLSGLIMVALIMLLVTQPTVAVSLIKLLAVSCAFFSIVFYLLGFIYKAETNRKLESFLSRINESSGIKASFRLFIRGGLYFFENARSSKGFFINFFLISFVINSFSLFLASFFTEYVAGGDLREAYASVINFPLYSSMKNALIGHLTAGVICSAFDLASFSITHKMIIWASRAQTLAGEVLRILLEIFTGIILLAAIVVLIPFFNWILFNFSLWDGYPEAWSATFGQTKDIVNALLIAVSSLLPTAGYLGLGLLIFFIRNSPRGLVNFYVRAGESLASDAKPVFRNLGYAFFMIAGVFTIFSLLT